MIHTPIRINPKKISMDTLGEMINKSFKAAEANLRDVQREVKGDLARIEEKIDAGFSALNSRMDYLALSRVPHEDE